MSASSVWGAGGRRCFLEGTAGGRKLYRDENTFLGELLALARLGRMVGSS